MLDKWVSDKFADLNSSSVANGKQASYFYAIFGISLVLFVVGVAAVLIIEAKRISTDFKENLLVEIVIKEDTAPESIMALQQQLQQKMYVKNVKYISKEQAKDIMKGDETLKKDLGENFMDILPYNPLYASFNLNLYENYINKDSFAIIKDDLSKFAEAEQVNFQNTMVESLDKNVKNATLIILVIGAAFLVFAISLIFSTIRLVMFSNRFSIKTQQLFGATRMFIVKPFLGKSLLNGLWGGLISCALIATLLLYFDYTIPELGLQEDLATFGLLFTGLIFFGILISFLSTLTAVFRYLRMKLEYLY